MKTRTTRTMTVALGLALWTAASLNAADVAVHLKAMDPKTSRDWRSAGGAEMQARFWNESGFGLALAIGYESWSARREFVEQLDAQGYYSSLIEGSASLVPLGASLLFRAPLSGDVDLTLETGFRYVFARSDITAAVYVEDDTGAVSYRDPITLSNGAVGLLALNIEARMTRQLALLAGIGYQVDLSRPSERYLGDDIGDTSFEAASLRIGLTWRF